MTDRLSTKKKKSDEIRAELSPITENLLNQIKGCEDDFRQFVTNAVRYLNGILN